jgi:hypothetical protein
VLVKPGGRRFRGLAGPDEIVLEDPPAGLAVMPGDGADEALAAAGVVEARDGSATRLDDTAERLANLPLSRIIGKRMIWKSRHCGGSWQDKTSVLIDGRPEIGLTPRLRKAISIPLRDASKAKDDGRLPMTDQNPRIFAVGTHGAEARASAEAIVHDAFHNVTFLTARSSICRSWWEKKNVSASPARRPVLGEEEPPRSG